METEHIIIIIIVLLLLFILGRYLLSRRHCPRSVPILRKKIIRYRPVDDRRKIMPSMEEHEMDEADIPSMTSRIMNYTNTDSTDMTDSGTSDGPHNPGCRGIPTIDNSPPREDIIRNKARDPVANCSSSPTDCSDLLFCPKGTTLGDPGSI